MAMKCYLCDKERHAYLQNATYTTNMRISITMSIHICAECEEKLRKKVSKQLRYLIQD